MNKFLTLLLFVLFSFPLLAVPSQKPDETKKAEANIPNSYKKRQIRFVEIISKEKNRSGLVRKAVQMAKDPKSEFRIDAINILAELKAYEALPDLYKIAKDYEVREFAVYALGEIPSEMSIPILIHYLNDPSENVRGNASYALNKITGMHFKYDYAAQTSQIRDKGIEDVRAWWKLNEATFKVREQTAEEKKAAEQAWESYGKQYIHDLNH